MCWIVHMLLRTCTTDHMLLDPFDVEFVIWISGNGGGGGVLVTWNDGPMP